MGVEEYYAHIARQSATRKIASRKCKLIFRWSFVTAGLTAAFWVIWYLIEGEAPISTVEMLSKSFSLSRWWDILIGPVWSTIIILVMTSERFRNDEDHPIFVCSVICLFFGLGVGLIFGLINGLITALIAGVVSGMALAAIIGIFFGCMILKNWIPRYGLWSKILDWLMVR